MHVSSYFWSLPAQSKCLCILSSSPFNFHHPFLLVSMMQLIVEFKSDMLCMPSWKYYVAETWSLFCALQKLLLSKTHNYNSSLAFLIGPHEIIWRARCMKSRTFDTPTIRYSGESVYLWKFSLTCFLTDLLKKLGKLSVCLYVWGETCLTTISDLSM